MADTPGDMAGKAAQLRELLAARRAVVVLFSGGVDSTLLLKVALDIPGLQVTALSFRGPQWPEAEAAQARELARALGVQHREVDCDPFRLPDFCHNTRQRCYACKKDLYRRGLEVVAALRAEALLDGANADDCRDYRPGMQAAAELGVSSPLLEVGLTKAEIRALSRQLDLPTWNHPSQSCLATRFPPDTELTPPLLAQVGEVEAWLRQRGFAPVRLRVHGPLVRLELAPEQWPELLQGGHLPELRARLAAGGWRYITLDLQGYQSGSMNSVPAADSLPPTSGDRPRRA